MRATKAYIASLGTTGVVLAASILMLAVVSAVVAFDRWPGSHVSGPPQALLLTERTAPIRVSATASGRSATQRQQGARPPVGGGAPRVRPESGPVRAERITVGIRPPAASTPSAPAAPVPQAVTKAVEPVQNAAAPIFGAVSNPRTTAGQVADGAQAVTNAVGGGLTEVSPDVGGAVAQTGQGLADTVRTVPLPDHLIPGY